jgi:RNA polymerase sigma-70 factor (ECF subfamily)
MSDFDEADLVERCRTGGDGAFAELVDRYKDLVYALIYRLVPDRSMVDDLAQDVFLKIHRGLPYFRGEARLSTWIYRIVQNACLRARTPGPAEVPLDPGPSPGGRPAPEHGAPDRAFGEIELQDRLRKAMAQLPDHYRLLVAAHYLKGVQYEALAETLGVPLGTVKTHLYRAKKRLRELLEG